MDAPLRKKRWLSWKADSYLKDKFLTSRVRQRDWLGCSEDCWRVANTVRFLCVCSASLLQVLAPWVLCLIEVVAVLLIYLLGTSRSLVIHESPKTYHFSYMHSLEDVVGLTCTRSALLSMAYAAGMNHMHRPYLYTSYLLAAACFPYLIVKMILFRYSQDAVPAAAIFIITGLFCWLHVFAARRTVEWARRRYQVGLAGFGYPWDDNKEALGLSRRPPAIMEPMSKAGGPLDSLHHMGHVATGLEAEDVPPEMLADADSRFLDVGGIRVHYKEVHPLAVTPGMNDRVAVVLVHGFGGGVFAWRHIMEQLAQDCHCRVIAFDRPGFGLTARPMCTPSSRELQSNPYSMGSQAHLLLQLCSMLGLEHVLLAAHADGCLLALRAASMAARLGATSASSACAPSSAQPVHSALRPQPCLSVNHAHASQPHLPSMSAATTPRAAGSRGAGLAQLSLSSSHLDGAGSSMASWGATAGTPYSLATELAMAADDSTRSHANAQLYPAAPCAQLQPAGAACGLQPVAGSPAAPAGSHPRQTGESAAAPQLLLLPPPSHGPAALGGGAGMPTPSCLLPAASAHAQQQVPRSRRPSGGGMGSIQGGGSMLVGSTLAAQHQPGGDPGAMASPDCSSEAGGDGSSCSGGGSSITDDTASASHVGRARHRRSASVPGAQQPGLSRDISPAPLISYGEQQPALGGACPSILGLAMLHPNLAGQMGPRLSRMLARSKLGRTILRPLLRSEIGEVANRRAWHNTHKLTAEVIELYKAPLRVEGWCEALIETTRLRHEQTQGDLPSYLADSRALPTLLLTGEHDRLVPPVRAEHLSMDLPHCRVVVLQDCGHLSHEEAPAALLAHLMPFCRQVLLQGGAELPGSVSGPLGVDVASAAECCVSMEERGHTLLFSATFGPPEAASTPPQHTWLTTAADNV